MRRTLTAILVLAMSTLFLAGCGGGDVVVDKASDSNSSSENSDNSGSDSGDSGDSGNDSGSDSGDSGDVPDMSIPDLSDMGNLGECMETAAAYAGIALTALGGKEAAEQAEDALDKLKGELPDELHDDLETLAEAYAVLATEGLMEGSEALDSPEFTEASDRISAYFEKECGSGNNG